VDSSKHSNGGEESHRRRECGMREMQ